MALVSSTELLKINPWSIYKSDIFQGKTRAEWHWNSNSYELPLENSWKSRPSTQTYWLKVEFYQVKFKPELMVHLSIQLLAQEPFEFLRFTKEQNAAFSLTHLLNWSNWRNPIKRYMNSMKLLSLFVPLKSLVNLYFMRAMMKPHFDWSSI